MHPRIGVGITTRNRRHIFEDTLKHWLDKLGDATLVVVDDASDVPVEDIPEATVIRHDECKGVARSKNDCIAALLDADCEHLFLADDDVHPRTTDWWRPYIASPEHHLSYQWPRKTRRNTISKWRIIPQPGHPLDATHFAIGFPRGVMLYADRLAIETIGGMDPDYGRGEHVDWQYRAWLAGLTTFTQTDENGETVAAYGDIRGSNTIWYARDEHEQIESTFGDIRSMRRLDRVGGRRWGRNWADGRPAYFDPWTGERR
jgi:GT2 family glycosyltransferase